MIMSRLDRIYAFAASVALLAALGAARRHSLRQADCPLNASCVPTFALVKRKNPSAGN